jgi:hypothetical protein
MKKADFCALASASLMRTSKYEKMLEEFFLIREFSNVLVGMRG